MGLLDRIGKNQNGPRNQWQQGRQAQPQQGNPMQMLQMLKKDPAGSLRRAGYSIPNGVNDPQKLTMHLINSGQVGNDRIQMVRQMLGGR